VRGAGRARAGRGRRRRGAHVDAADGDDDGGQSVGGRRRRAPDGAFGAGGPQGRRLGSRRKAGRGRRGRAQRLRSDGLRGRRRRRGSVGMVRGGRARSRLDGRKDRRPRRGSRLVAGLFARPDGSRSRGRRWGDWPDCWGCRRRHCRTRGLRLLRARPPWRERGRRVPWRHGGVRDRRRRCLHRSRGLRSQGKTSRRLHSARGRPLWLAAVLEGVARPVRRGRGGEQGARRRPGGHGRRGAAGQALQPAHAAHSPPSSSRRRR
jgi:hypothetical protein